MKLISKTGRILKSNSGETIVEVLVAFTVLSIMLIVFAQGIAWATSTEFNASESRNAADQAMVALQDQLATEATPGDNARGKANCGVAGIDRCEYVVNGQTYVVYQPAG